MGAIILGGLIGGFFGLGIGYLIGSEREPCEHEFEKIIDDKECIAPGKSHVVAYMCKKCGKRKITKV